jgi:hypothetical protein
MKNHGAPRCQQGNVKSLLLLTSRQKLDEWPEDGIEAQALPIAKEH